jgi:hypothetical protein
MPVSEFIHFPDFINFPEFIHLLSDSPLTVPTVLVHQETVHREPALVSGSPCSGPSSGISLFPFRLTNQPVLPIQLYRIVVTSLIQGFIGITFR